MVTQGSAGECSLRYGSDAMDFAKVTAMLATAFWCEGISEDEVRRGAENSALVVGAFLGGSAEKELDGVPDVLHVAPGPEVLLPPRRQAIPLVREEALQRGTGQAELV